MCVCVPCWACACQALFLLPPHCVVTTCLLAVFGELLVSAVPLPPYPFFAFVHLTDFGLMSAVEPEIMEGFARGIQVCVRFPTRFSLIYIHLVNQFMASSRHALSAIVCKFV